MFDLSKKTLPNTVEVCGKVYLINTDFQFFIIFSRMLKEKHSLEDYDFMYAGKVPHNRQSGLNALIEFAFPKRELPHEDEVSPGSTILLDYEKDSPYIYAAFRHYYNIDLLDGQSLHWYKFSALLDGLKDTKLNDIIQIRSYKPGKNDSAEYKTSMNRLKRMWYIEPPLTEEEQKQLEEFEMLAKGKRDYINRT